MADKHRLAQWLIENPVSSDGRPTNQKDAKEALKITGNFRMKAGNLRDNRASLRFEPRGNQSQSDNRRVNNSAQQTVGPRTFSSNPIPNTQKHHLRMMSLYEPLFRGLSKKDQQSLAQHFVDIGMPLGDVDANRGDLPAGPHSHLHNYMRKHGMTGKHMPDFSQLPLSERKKVAQVFYKDFIQSDIDQKTMKIMADEAAANPADYAAKYSKIGSQILSRTNAIKNGKDLFEFSTNGGSELLQEAADVIPGLRPNADTDVGRRLGNAISKNTKHYLERTEEILSKFYQNGSKAVDTNGISSI